jgi:hypothetical protein
MKAATADNSYKPALKRRDPNSATAAAAISVTPPRPALLALRDLIQAAATETEILHDWVNSHRNANNGLDRDAADHCFELINQIYNLINDAVVVEYVENSQTIHYDNNMDDAASALIAAAERYGLPKDVVKAIGNSPRAGGR